MCKLHLFNPDNDLALANGSANFTPPRSALGLRRSAATLPMWYGEPGDRFVGAVNERWFETVSRTFGLDVEPTMFYDPGYRPEPWGWSAAARRAFQAVGVPDADLPTEEEIARWRSLSHRAESAAIARGLYEALPELTASPDVAPVIATDEREALEVIDRFGRAMLKLPWSNAGRGQQDSGRIPRSTLEDRVRGMLNRQGAIEIEPWFEREADFALLFDEASDYVGLSLFTTDTHGGWTGNILADDAEIARRLGVDPMPMVAVLGPMLRAQAEAAGWRGPTGVDMMIARDASGSRVCPLVEVNRRRTMGHVAHRLTERFLAPGVTGRLTVEPRTVAVTPDVTGPVVRDGRLTAGDVDLVDPGGEFRVKFKAGDER